MVQVDGHDVVATTAATAATAAPCQQLEDAGTAAAEQTATAAKKKRKKKKKTAAATTENTENTELQTAVQTADAGATETEAQHSEKGEPMPCATESAPNNKNKNKKKKKKTKIVPPSVPIAAQFPDGVFPVGEVQQYALARTTEAEKRHVSRFERMNDETLNKIRKAAECHRQTRTYFQSAIREGMQMTQLCEMIEESNRRLIEEHKLERGLGFPTGCSINEIAAHWTPNKGDDTAIKRNDIVKFDYGVHVDGYIIDCAWTHTFNPARYEGLMKGVRDATNTGIREAGIDVRLNEVGAAIQETMESYECEIDGKLLPVKVIRNLNGHSIGKYQIHAGNSVPCIDNGDTTKMEENEMYAIETFGSIGGCGRVIEKGECSHYMVNYTNPPRPQTFSNQRQKDLFKTIKNNFSTLAFCRRWLDRIHLENYVYNLKRLCEHGHVSEYPPLVELPGAYTAQYEHTILLRPQHKEVVSRGTDY